MPLGHKPLEDTVGKGEIARNEQFSPFATVFSTRMDSFLPFLSNMTKMPLSSTNSFILEESEICHPVMG